MRLFRLLVFIPFIFALISCGPIEITTKVAPFEVEPPKETLQFKKLPNEAVILIDDSQIYSATHYSADVIHTVEFPAGSLLRQALPVYFDKMFQKTKYEKALSSLVPSNAFVIHTRVSNMNFTQDCCMPLVLDVKATTEFTIYDNDILPVSLPILSTGSGKLSKPGLFATINEKEYGQTAYQAIVEAVKTGVDLIYNTVTNPKAQVSEAKAIINKDPTNIQAFKLIANLSLKNNDLAEALAASQMITQLDPKDTDGYLLLYKCYLAQRKYKDALAQLEHAVSLAPKSAFLLMKIYDFYIERGQYQKAAQAVKKYIEQRPDDYYAPLRVALLSFRSGQYDEAIKLSEKMINNLSFSGIGAGITKNEDEYPKIKSVTVNSPAQKAGIEVNDEIIEIDEKPALEMKLNEIIQKLKGQEGSQLTLTIRKPQTGETVKKALVREKFYTSTVAASYLSLIGLSLIEKSDKTNAEKYIEEAQKVSPFVKLAKASLYLKQMQYDKALNEAKSIKDSDYALLIQSIAYAKLGNYEESLKQYKKISKSNDLLITDKAKNELIVAVSPYLEKIENRALEYERVADYKKALKEYASLIEISNPDKAQWIRGRVARIIASNPSLVELVDESRKHFLNAEVLFTNNKFDEALKELELAEKIQPFNPQIYFNKALLYEKLSDYAKAIEQMEIYLQLSPDAPNAQMIKDQIYKWRFILEKEI